MVRKTIFLFARLCDEKVTVASEVRDMQRGDHNSKAIDPARMPRQDS